MLTDYLTKASPAWAKAMGTGLTMNWPVGQGAEQNKGVAQAVRATEGSLGYVEVNYAVQNDLSQGWVKNAAGQFRKADFESMGAAADAVADMPADFRVSITNAPGQKAYPISSFTWLLVPSKMADPARTDALRKVLRWVLTLGQKSTLELEYQLLPVTLLDKIDNQIDAIR
jgi:phosphate transport system substrate-binding protein